MTDKMDCTACREDLESYIGGDLAPDRAREVAEHVSSCEECAAAYESTRRVMAAVKDLGDAFVPSQRFEPNAASTRQPARVGWGWRFAVAASLAVAALSSSALSIPALAEQLPLPVSREMADLREDRDALEAKTEALEDQVEELKIQIKKISGEEMPEVQSAEEALPPEVNYAVQKLAVDFIKAQYARDMDALESMATDRLAADLAKNPEMYLKTSEKLVFAQITNVGKAEDGTFLVFVRLSDDEFADSTYQEDFEIKLVDGAYKVDFCGMDA